MRVGTKSLLFGVHAFWWHPITVALAWRRVYRRWPSWRESVAIAVHDLGYWRCRTMDGADGAPHPLAGARIARLLAGDYAGRLVLGHSGRFCKMLDIWVSELCFPDKVSVLYDPAVFYMVRGMASGEIAEYSGKVGWRKCWLWLQEHRRGMVRRLARLEGHGECEWCGAYCEVEAGGIVECEGCK